MYPVQVLPCPTLPPRVHLLYTTGTPPYPAVQHRGPGHTAEQEGQPGLRQASRAWVEEESGPGCPELSRFLEGFRPGVKVTKVTKV